jgi:zinc/manganese transport system substrate-binding protein
MYRSISHNKKQRPFTRLLFGGIFLMAVAGGIVVLTLHQITPIAKPARGTIQVVAAENFWGDIAGQIGGSHVHVVSIITNPSTDPHLYESNANNASSIASSDIVITNGLGYDEFMNKLLSVSHNSSRTVLNAATILSKSGEGNNPHIWYDITDIPKIASTIAQTYISVDPAHTVEYQHNLQVFDDSLLPLINTLTAIKRNFPRAPVAYTERVAGYALDEAELSVKSPAGFAAAVENGNDPSPADTAAMDNLMTSKGVKVLLYNAQAASAVTQHVQELAKQNNIPVVGVTETLPTNEHSYQSWQQDQLDALQKALGTSINE